MGILGNPHILTDCKLMSGSRSPEAEGPLCRAQEPDTPQLELERRQRLPGRSWIQREGVSVGVGVTQSPLEHVPGIGRGGGQEIYFGCSDPPFLHSPIDISLTEHNWQWSLRNVVCRVRPCSGNKAGEWIWEQGSKRLIHLKICGHQKRGLRI